MIKRLNPMVINEFCSARYSLSGVTFDNDDLSAEMNEILEIGMTNRTHIYIRASLVWTRGSDFTKPLVLCEEIRWLEVDAHVSAVDSGFVIEELKDDAYWENARALDNHRLASRF